MDEDRGDLTEFTIKNYLTLWFEKREVVDGHDGDLANLVKNRITDHDSPPPPPVKCGRKITRLQQNQIILVNEAIKNMFTSQRSNHCGQW